MTLLLASVSNIHEAGMALAGGADIIDLKEPSDGALGAVSTAIQAEIVRLVANRRPVSATIGNPPMDAQALSQAIHLTAGTGVNIVKVGLPHPRPYHKCLKVLSDNAARGTHIVAVLFAEQKPPLHLLDELARAGCIGVMLDTADKSAGSLHDFTDRMALSAFVRRARELGLLSGFAGSLTAADIAPLLDMKPGYLGFRGALCGAGGRTGRLSLSALTQVRKIFDRRTRHMATPAFRTPGEHMGHNPS